MGEGTETAEDQLIRVVESESEISIYLQGTVDIRLTALLRDAACQVAGSEKRVRLDWSQASHVDLSVLQVLLALKAALAGDGREMQIGALSLKARQHVEAGGLAELFRHS